MAESVPADGAAARARGKAARYGVLPGALLMLVAVSGLLSACSSAPTCPAGLNSYKDKCLTTMAIQYVGCVEGRGINATTELSAGASGTLEVVTNASLNVAYKRVEEENTPVALQIVKDCLDIAKATSPPNDPEQQVASNFQQQVLAGTPSISIAPASAKTGGQVTVTGTKFWPTEQVSIYVHASLVAQVAADTTGAFSTVITVPSDAPPPGFSTTITATGKSSAKSAEAPFHTDP